MLISQGSCFSRVSKRWLVDSLRPNFWSMILALKPMTRVWAKITCYWTLKFKNQERKTCNLYFFYFLFYQLFRFKDCIFLSQISFNRNINYNYLSNIILLIKLITTYNYLKNQLIFNYFLVQIIFTYLLVLKTTLFFFFF